jgi:DinB superfamily
MHSKDAILGTFAFGSRIVERYLADLSDADLLLRPVAGQNHIAWQLGHLIASERKMMEGIKPGTSPDLPAGFESAHGPEDTATKSDDPERFLTKDQYLALMKAQRDATRAALEALSDAELDTPAPESLRTMAPTVGTVFLLAGNHVLMHVGQFVSVRRMLNKPVTI